MEPSSLPSPSPLPAGEGHSISPSPFGRGTKGEGEAAVPFLYIQAATALALAFFLSLGFFGLDYRGDALFQSGAPVWTPSVPLDAAIPFIPAWIWVYIAYYPLCFAPLLIMELRRDRDVFWRTVGAYLLQFGFCFLIFWLWPSKMLRPDLNALTPHPSTLNPLTLYALETTYRVDPGYNVFPSLHVSLLVFTACLFQRFKGPKWGGTFWGLACLISTSTMLVKQHYLLDVIAGSLLGTLAFFISFPSPAGRGAGVRGRS